MLTSPFEKDNVNLKHALAEIKKLYFEIHSDQPTISIVRKELKRVWGLEKGGEK